MSTVGLRYIGGLDWVNKCLMNKKKLFTGSSRQKEIRSHANVDLEKDEEN